MLNYWWVTRPKRKLNSIPEVLATFAEVSLDQEWQGQRDSHLSFEDLLEQTSLKRIGERRDRTGGGGRTYQAWVMSLGLIFIHEATKKIKLTLAGEAIMNGESPVDVLKHQILKYQFPSAFSTGRNINVSPRFKIHPFVFILRLLADTRVNHLSTEELAKIVIVEAENESEQCFEHIVSRIIQFRNFGDQCLDSDFSEKYSPSKGAGSTQGPYAHLLDVSNTLINWLEYTQLAIRDPDDNNLLKIIDGKYDEVKYIVSNPPAFIDRPNSHEYFQRKYGVDPNHRKDTRDLTGATTITALIIAEQKIKNAFIAESIRQPISSVTTQLIDSISESTGIRQETVEATLNKFYPYGSIGAFMTTYFEMAFKGTEHASDFEIATTEIFNSVFKLKATHIGQQGRTPDVLVVSDLSGFCGIIDNKAYHNYSITNDHHNRMVHNYIGGLNNYYDGPQPLSFFSYISGGFGRNINKQIRDISAVTGVSGSAMNVSNMIELIRRFDSISCNHDTIKDIFSVGRQINLSDVQYFTKSGQAAEDDDFYIT